MNVRELIDHLAAFDSDMEVAVEYDGHFLTAKSVQVERVLQEGSSWAHYASARVLDRNSMFPMTDDEHAINLKSAQKTVVVIWGTSP